MPVVTLFMKIFLWLQIKFINPIINSHLENQWVKNWENIKGHNQIKYWLSMPDPYLTSKLLNMSREQLGKCIQFFTGHGWWKKHLKLTKLCNNKTCWLYKLPDSIESPFHLFSECVAMSATRQGLFNYPYPSQQLGNNKLCQVAEFALIDRVCNLINIDNNHFNVNSLEWALLWQIERG